MSEENKNEIKFDRLHLWRSSSSGIIHGTMSIKSTDGSEVKVNLPSEALEKVVDLVADKLAEAATIQADRLIDAILDRKSDGELTSK